MTKFDVDFTTSEQTAYKVTDAKPSYVTLEEIQSAPAGTALILEGKPNTYTLYQALSEVKDVKDNLFLAGGSQTGDGSTIYALGNKNVVGFYLVGEGVAVPKGKGYLKIGPTSEVKAFIPIGDEAAGIHTVTDAEGSKEGVIYNLTGQRVARPTQSGIYIVNGKKVWINK